MGYNGFTKYTILKTNVPKNNDNYFISTEVCIYLYILAKTIVYVFEFSHFKFPIRNN